jgi:hypothetical protein
MLKHISQIKKAIILTIIIDILICAFVIITVARLNSMIIDLRIFIGSDFNYHLKILIFIISALLVILCVYVAIEQIKKNVMDLILLQKNVYDVIEVKAIKNNYSIDSSERFVLYCK